MSSIGRLILIFVMCGTVGCSTLLNPTNSDPSISLVSTGEGYVHEETGVELPPVLGPFVRTGVHALDAEEHDIAASYVLMDRGVDASVYVYLYPIENAHWTTPTPLKGHFREIKSEVMALHPDAKLISDSDYTLDASRVGRRAIFMFPGSFNDKPEMLESQAILFRRGEWFIKYRITYPKRRGERVGDSVEDLMRTVRWPDLS